MKTSIYHYSLRFVALAMLAGGVASCDDDDIDNSYSRNMSVIQLATSADYVVLDEDKPDAVALTLDWSEAHPYGNEYITTYRYEYEVSGSKATAIKEYEDDGHFTRSYTNAELQEILVEHFGCLTSSVATLNLTVTASFEGPRVVIPDIATANVRIRPTAPNSILPTVSSSAARQWAQNLLSFSLHRQRRNSTFGQAHSKPAKSTSR